MVSWTRLNFASCYVLLKLHTTVTDRAQRKTAFMLVFILFLITCSFKGNFHFTEEKKLASKVSLIRWVADMSTVSSSTWKCFTITAECCNCSLTVNIFFNTLSGTCTQNLLSTAFPSETTSAWITSCLYKRSLFPTSAFTSEFFWALHSLL